MERGQSAGCRVRKFGGVLILVIGVSSSSACAYRDLVRGVDLEQTPAKFSLRSEFPTGTGWQSPEYEAARAYAESLRTTAVVAIQDRQLLAEWGQTEKRISGHSVRKSLVSALCGIAFEKGLLDTSKTLAELGIDESNSPLTARERQARIADLLTSRSGIYHDSVKDDSGEARPERGAHPPGAFFYYNNWSFNAIGAIFERETQRTLGEAFFEWIAGPIGMEDFRVEDVHYIESDESDFPAYRFWISTRDLARFGMLYLEKGRWADIQVIPESWIAATVKRRSDLGANGYGLMWWILEDGSYLASGTGGQKLLVDPARELVVVNRVDTGSPGLGRGLWWNHGPRVNRRQFTEMTRRILASAGPEVPSQTN